jgi:hypothetical protein
MKPSLAAIPWTIGRAGFVQRTEKTLPSLAGLRERAKTVSLASQERP